MSETNKLPSAKPKKPMQPASLNAAKFRPIYVLHLDDALHQQPEFIEACQQHLTLEVDVRKLGASVRLWGNNADLDKLSRCLHEFLGDISHEKPLFFMGSGDFHHITALLLNIMLASAEEDVTLIHFDNHPDFMSLNFGSQWGMSCGTWVRHAAAHPKINKIITLGVCSDDLAKAAKNPEIIALFKNQKLEIFPNKRFDSDLYHPPISDYQEDDFVNALRQSIKTRKIYITIDKDVLAPGDADTNWDQGIMRFEFMQKIIRNLAATHSIVGADVCGDCSKPIYRGPLWMRLAKKIEIWFDQPKFRRMESNVNSHVNIKLLNLFTEIIT